MGKKRKISYDPAPTAIDKKESKKARRFGFLLALIGIAICILVAVAMHPKDKTVFVEMKVRDFGTVVIKLDGEAAPKTVDNFVKLVENGFYDGLTFHRVKNGFMIQGGCPDGNGTGDSGKYIEGEFEKNGYKNPISHTRGVISMARFEEDFNSASSQFFICTADSTDIDGMYASFGVVVEGMETVDAVSAAALAFANPMSGAISDKTNQPVIEYIKVLRDYELKGE